jgi:hypothetical protein
LGFGNKSLFLSFGDSITFHEMRNTLDSVSDTGNIVVEALYILEENGKVAMLRLSDEPPRVDGVRIIGAKVYAPAALIEDLSQQEEVVLVEIATDDMNDYDFVPFGIFEDNEEASTQPPCQTEQETNAPQDSPAPPDFEKFINLNIPGVIEANFISDYRFIAITRDSVILYEISEAFEIEAISEFALRNHRKRLSTNGESMLISGVRGGKTVLLLADAQSESLVNIDISSTVGSGELLNAFYDDATRRIIMRVRSRDYNAIYIVDRDTLGISRVPDNSHDAVILALDGNSLYFASASIVRKYDITTGASVELHTFDEPVSFERNADLSGFVIVIGNTAQVFNAKTETLTESADVTEVLEDFYSQPTSHGRRVISALFSLFEVTSESIKILIK